MSFFWLLEDNSSSGCTVTLILMYFPYTLSIMKDITQHDSIIEDHYVMLTENYNGGHFNVIVNNDFYAWRFQSYGKQQIMSFLVVGRYQKPRLYLTFNIQVLSIIYQNHVSYHTT